MKVLRCAAPQDYAFGNANAAAGWLPYGWRYSYLEGDREAAAAGTGRSGGIEWYLRLLQDDAFVRAVQARWQELRATVLADAHVRALVCRCGPLIARHASFKRSTC